MWLVMLAIVVLFTASLVVAFRTTGGGAVTGANKPVISPDRLVLDTQDLVIEGCYVPLPSGEQEVRLRLYNTGLTALREVKLEITLDGKPPKAPKTPLYIRRFPRHQKPEVRLLFGKTQRPYLTVRAQYQWGLLATGAGGAQGGKLLSRCSQP